MKWLQTSIFSLAFNVFFLSDAVITFIIFPFYFLFRYRLCFNGFSVCHVLCITYVFLLQWTLCRRQCSDTFGSKGYLACKSRPQNDQLCVAGWDVKLSYCFCRLFSIMIWRCVWTCFWLALHFCWAPILFRDLQITYAVHCVVLLLAECSPCLQWRGELWDVVHW